jgi:hypothetical protein
MIKKSILFVFMFISQVYFASGSVYGPDNRISYSDLDKFNPKILADATATQIDTRYLKPGTGGDFFSYPTGKIQNQCPGEKFSKMKTLGGCSGFLIAPDILVAAGHCYDYKNLGCGTDAWLFKHYKSPKDSKIKLLKENIYKCKEVLDYKKDQMGDFVVLKLDRANLNVKPLKISLNDEVEKTDPVAVLGYPLGLPFTYTPGGQVRNIDKNYLHVDSDSFKNNSGSALINLRTGFVEGILTNSRRGLSADPIDGCQLSKSYGKEGNIVLINRLQRIPYLQKIYKFKKKLSSFTISNNCTEEVSIIAKYRTIKTREWNTNTFSLNSKDNTIIKTNRDDLYLRVETRSGKVLIRGRDFYGFADNSRWEEYGFKKFSQDETTINLCL